MRYAYFKNGGVQMEERRWLKEYREYLGLSQDKMAEKLGIPKSTYTSYESGHRTPSVERAKELEKKSDIDWRSFFEKNVLTMRTLVRKKLIMSDSAKQPS